MVTIMKTYDFSIYNNRPAGQEGQLVEVRSGKGHDSSVYIDHVVFSYLDGLIWDKHREYGNKIKTKIHAAEWQRILEGFSKAADKLEECNKECDLADVLKFEVINPNYPLSDIKEVMPEMAVLIRALWSWITNKISTEKLVFIIQPVAR